MDDDVTDAAVAVLAHPARVALAVVDRGLDDLGVVNLWSMSDRELLDLRVDQERTLARLQAQVLATTREIDARDAAKATGASSTEAWLRGRCLRHPGRPRRRCGSRRSSTGTCRCCGRRW